MGKRKTKAQKKIAELRHKLSYQTSATNMQSSTRIDEKTNKKLFYKVPENLKRTYAASSYTYVKTDLLKTFFLSAIIIAFQLLLLVLLKTHAINLLSLRY